MIWIIIGCVVLLLVLCFVIRGVFITIKYHILNKKVEKRRGDDGYLHFSTKEFIELDKQGPMRNGTKFKIEGERFNRPNKWPVTFESSFVDKNGYFIGPYKVILSQEYDFIDGTEVALWGSTIVDDKKKWKKWFEVDKVESR
jgi:hypothetical protein